MFLVLVGCAASVPAPSPPECAEGEALDGDGCVPVGCGVGPWGDLPVDADTIYVDRSASAGGEGTASAPLTTIQAGVDLAAERDGALVAVAAGTYVENLVMGDGYKDIDLEGRCRDLVTIDGSTADEAPTVQIAGDSKRPAVEL